MTRPFMRHSIDQLEALPACPDLIAELGYRSTHRARKLLDRLKSETASVASVAIADRPAGRHEASPPKGRPIVRAKAAASVRASLAHPGPIAETWQDCTQDQLAWWRDRYSWHPTLFVSRFPSRSPAEMMDVVKRADKWAARTKRKAPPVGRTVAEFAGDTGLAYVLPLRQSPAVGHGVLTVTDWRHTPNRHFVQRVAETDPTHYGAISRRILAEIAARDAADESELPIAA